MKKQPKEFESVRQVEEHLQKQNPDLVPQHVRRQAAKLKDGEQINARNAVDSGLAGVADSLDEAVAKITMLDPEDNELAPEMLERINRSPGDHTDEVRMPKYVDEESIRLREKYRSSGKLKFGDMPKVYAYEVESNVRECLKDILRPVIEQQKKLQANMVDCNERSMATNQDIRRLNQVIDLDIRLRDVVADTNKKIRDVHELLNASSDDMRDAVDKVKQLGQVHDDKIVKMADEQKGFNRKLTQVRVDLRNFEALNADHVKQSIGFTKDQVDVLNKRLAAHENQVDAHAVELARYTRVVEQLRDREEELLVKFGVLQSQLDRHERSLFKLEHIDTILQQNERFLGYVLPLRTQAAIYRTIKPLITEKDKLLDLMEHQTEAVEMLVADLDEADAAVDEAKQQRHGRDKKTGPPAPKFGMKARPQKKESTKQADDDWKSAPVIHAFNKTKYERPDLSENIKMLKEALAERAAMSPDSGSGSGTARSEKSGAGRPSSVSSKPEPVTKKSPSPSSASPSPVSSSVEATPPRKKRKSKSSKARRKPSPSSESEQESSSPKEKEEKPKPAAVAKQESPKKEQASPTKEEGSPFRAKKQATAVSAWANKAEASVLRRGLAVDDVLPPLQYKLKLKHLKISNKQLFEFAARIGRRLLKNGQFTRKLATMLNDGSVSDGSERREPAWGLDADDGKADRRAFRDGAPDDSSETEWEDRDVAIDAIARRERLVKEQMKKDKKKMEKRAKEKKDSRRKAKKAPLSIGAAKRNAEQAAKEDEKRKKEEKKQEKSQKKLAEAKADSKPQETLLQTQAPTEPSPVKEANDVDQHPRMDSAARKDQEAHKASSQFEQSPGRSSYEAATPAEQPSPSRGRHHGHQPTLEQSSPWPAGGGAQPGALEAGMVRRMQQQLGALESRFQKFEIQQINAQNRREQRQQAQAARQNARDSGKQADSKLSKRGAERQAHDDAQPKDEEAIQELRDEVEQNAEDIVELQAAVDGLKKKVSEVEYVLETEDLAALRKSGERSENTYTVTTPMSGDTEAAKLRQQLRAQREIEALLKQAKNHVADTVLTFNEKMEQCDQVREAMAAELKRLRRQNFSVEQKFNFLADNTKDVRDGLVKCEERQNVIDNSVAICLKLQRIGYALQHQDEKDRQQLGLFGAGEDNPPPTKKINNAAGEPMLSFEENCLNCGNNGQKASLLPALTKALKMACLSYKPSAVLFDQKMYDRTKLVEAQGYLLFLALKQLTHLDFDGVERQLLGASFESAMGSDSKLDGMLTERANDLNIFEAERHSKHTDGLGQNSEESIFAKSTATPVGVSLPPSTRHVDVRLSKEATKLASLVPQIHNVRDGKLVPNAQRLAACPRCEADLTANSVDTGYSKRAVDYEKAASQYRQPIISKQISPRRMSRLANSVEITDALSKTGYSQDTSTRSGKGSRHPGKGTRNVFNFNTINVVGTPANLGQVLNPMGQQRLTPNSLEHLDPKEISMYGYKHSQKPTMLSPKDAARRFTVIPPLAINQQKRQLFSRKAPEMPAINTKHLPYVPRTARGAFRKAGSNGDRRPEQVLSGGRASIREVEFAVTSGTHATEVNPMVSTVNNSLRLFSPADLTEKPE